MINQAKIAIIQKTYQQTKSLRRTAKICAVAVNTARRYIDINRKDIINRIDNNINSIDTKDTNIKEDINIDKDNRYNNDNNIINIQKVIKKILSNFNNNTYDIDTLTPYQASLVLGILIDKKVLLTSKVKGIAGNQSVIFNFFSKVNMKDILEEMHIAKRQLESRKDIPHPPAADM